MVLELAEAHSNELKELKKQFKEDRRALKAKCRHLLKLQEREKLTLEMQVEEQAKEHTEKMESLHVNTLRLQSALKSSLPGLDEFLLSKNLEDYTEVLKQQGYDSVAELLLADAEDLQDLGMKTGHFRKLQTAIEEMQAARPVIVLKADTSPRRFMKEHSDLASENDNWCIGFDQLSKQKYWFNAQYDVTTFTDPGSVTPHVYAQRQHVLEAHKRQTAEEETRNDQDMLDG